MPLSLVFVPLVPKAMQDWCNHTNMCIKVWIYITLLLCKTLQGPESKFSSYCLLTIPWIPAKVLELDF